LQTKLMNRQDKEPVFYNDVVTRYVNLTVR